MIEATETLHPHDLDAERSVLGGVILDAASVLPEIADLPGDALYLPAHREILEAARAVSRAELPVDLVTMGDELARRGVLARLEGGTGYLVALANAIPTVTSVRHYAQIVAQKALLRQLILTCADLTAQARAGARSSVEILGDAQRLINALSTQAVGRGEPVKLGDAVEAFLDDVEAWGRTGGQPFVPTGIAGLDRLGILRPERLIVVAARPGKGKSALTSGWGLAAAEAGHPTLILALEMSQAEQAARAVSAKSGLSTRYLESAEVNFEDWKGPLMRARMKLHGLPLWIHDENMTLPQIEAVCRRWRAKHAPGNTVPLVVLDMVQLVDVPDARTAEARVSQASLACKRLAKELRCPIVAVSSMNRAVEHRDDGSPPRLSDLRESGQLESDAHVVVFVTRPDGGETQSDQEATLWVEKNRGGETGKIEAWWHGPTTTFRSRTPYANDRPDRRPYRDDDAPEGRP